MIAINGNGITGAGIELSGNSGGSTIKGLDIVDFAGAGIDVETGSNTVQSNYVGINFAGNAGPGNQTGILINGIGNAIGGTSGGVGNVIAFNTGDAVNVNSGNGDSIRSNLIYGNGSAIVLQSGTNHDQLPPTLSSATSSSGTTIIKGSVPGGTPDGTILDFYGDAPVRRPRGRISAHTWC